MFLWGRLQRLARPDRKSTGITVWGSGYGHAVGMSQYGAYGRALAGQSYDEILASYYRGVELRREPQDPAVRVQLGEGSLHGSLNLEVPQVGETVFRDLATGKVAKLRPATYRVRYLAVSGLYGLVNLSSGNAVGAYRGPIDFETATGGTLGYGGRRYRGVLEVLRSGSKLLVINHLPMELYVRGVLPNEMLPFWPFEALKSQAVVARSYALSVRRSDLFECYADTRDQIYGGASSESPATNEAIAATTLTYAVFEGKPIQALFHSSSAGCTEDSSYVFNATPYLKAVRDLDPEGRPFEASVRLNCPWTSWSGSIDPNGSPQLGIGAITSIMVLDRSPSGRAIKAEVRGTRGRVTISGEYNLRYAIKSSGLRLADGSLRPPGPLPSARISFFNP